MTALDAYAKMKKDPKIRKAFQISREAVKRETDDMISKIEAVVRCHLNEKETRKVMRQLKSEWCYILTEEIIDVIQE